MAARNTSCSRTQSSCREDKREPQIVPDRHDGEHSDGGDRGTQQRRNHLAEDARLRHAVAAHGVAQVVRDLLDEFGEDKDRHRQALCDVVKNKGEKSVVEAEMAHHRHDGN
jgi:hypothetical protein